jgi:hypothetical protein
MDDFLLELLGWLLEPIFQAILEAFLEYVIGALVDVILRGTKEAFKTTAIENPVLACVGYVFLGAVLGGLSLLVFPHPLVHPSRIHGINVIVSPVIAGVMMSLTGAILRRREKRTTRLESFGYGFALAFGVVLVRFLFTK